MGKSESVNAGSTDKKSGGAGRQARSVISKSTRAGLVWPVSRVNNKINNDYPKLVNRIGAGAPVFVAAVSEYMMAEIIELSMNQARANKRSRITTADIMTAIRNDPQLHKAMHGLVVMAGEKQKRPADFITTKHDAHQKALAKAHRVEEASAGAEA
jgi:histone H2A